jgi:acetyl esterase/lipase
VEQGQGLGNGRCNDDDEDVAAGSASLAATSDLHQALRKIGPLWATDIRRYSQAVKALYEPVLATRPKDGVTVLRDVAYGPHPRQVLDLFRPRVDKAPVVVFMHGGAFVRGDKRTTDELYDNVLVWFARQGCLGVNLEYRLAPESPYPGGALDLAAAIDWLREHAASRGGDPERIHVIGHSAGGTHLASYLGDPVVGRFGEGVSAAVLVSARLQADVLPTNPNRDGVAAYFGSDPATHMRASPIRHAAHVRVPTLVVTAEFENPWLDVYGRAYAERLRRHGRVRTRHLVMPGHNHMSIVAHFNTDEDVLGKEILGFCDVGEGARAGLAGR